MSPPYVLVTPGYNSELRRKRKKKEKEEVNQKGEERKKRGEERGRGRGEGDGRAGGDTYIPSFFESCHASQI